MTFDPTPGTISAYGLAGPGPHLDVRDLTFPVSPGRVTGFLGPNGAGKPDIGIRHFSTRVVIVPGHQQHYMPMAPVSLITTGSQHH